MNRYDFVKWFRIASVIGILLALWAGLSLPVAGSAVTYGAIDGMITCEGNPVPGVVVSVSGALCPPPDQICWTGTTGDGATLAAGRYYTDRILAPGTYTVRHYYMAGLCQFAETAREAVVQAGQTTTVNFAGTACSNLIRNGGFENFDVWQVGSTPWPARYSNTQYRTGAWSMRSGIEPAEPDRVTESSFFQDVTIPADAASATLNFWYRPFTQEVTNPPADWKTVNWAGYAPERSLAGAAMPERSAELRPEEDGAAAWYSYDWQEVLVLDQNYRLLEVLERGLSNRGASGWIARSYDLTPYKGRKIYLYWNTINNGVGGRRTYMYVDDVEVRYCIQPPSCTVTPTNQWVNLYGLNSTFRGAPLIAGQIVRAYDQAGHLAGCFVVRSTGRYGAMPVYADDPATPADEGLSPGEMIKFKIDNENAIPLGPDEAKWTENGALLHVELGVGGDVTRMIPLHAGWNLISFDVMPADTAIGTVLAPIAGKFTRVLSSTCAEGALSYYPSLPPAMNTLRRLDPYHGYWIFMTQATILPVNGIEVPDGTPIALCGRWNLVSYLPNGPLLVRDALYSIAGKYSVALGFDQGALSYYVDLPADMNSLRNLAPGFGYWIRATQDTTLVYPPAGLSAAAALSKPNYLRLDDDVTPTFRWADAYSLNTTFGGEPVPVGAVIAAYDPDGVKVGKFVVKQAGRYGPMPIYGDDPATPEDEGARPGDRLTFTINGKPAISPAGKIIWQGERTLMQVDLMTKME